MGWWIEALPQTEMELGSSFLKVTVVYKGSLWGFHVSLGEGRPQVVDTPNPSKISQGIYSEPEFPTIPLPTHDGLGFTGVFPDKKRAVQTSSPKPHTNFEVAARNPKV